jgi:hypothetical protein
MLLRLAILLQTTQPDSTLQQTLVHRNGRIPRAVTARFAAEPPRIDGKLNDPIWATVTPERGFRRDVPSDGNPATQETEVRIVYDRDALYVGARMVDDRPDLISRRLNRRDSFGAFNDVFFILLDSYHDHRTQFVLGVTAAGEQRDAITTADGAGDFDTGWDPVWEARATIDSAGWVAEMRIPFSQLRFPQASEQVWGVQFRRDNVRAGEAVDWHWSPRTEPGQVSKFGHLLGLQNVPAPKRLEFLPYFSSQARFTEGVAPGNPFDDGSVGSVAAGLDMKYGITSDLTLNATINPDFGQVEADPSVVNLTAFETFFEERRPFFVEGSGIFGFSGSFGFDRFFYSRRIGRMPTASALGRAAFVDEPTASSILGAVKFSGRTSSGWSIGMLDAVTGREQARLSDIGGGSIRRVPVEPLANYGVIRIKRDLGGGSSGYGFVATTVTRAADSADFSFLRTSAVAGAADFFHRWRRNTYQLSGYLGFSRIGGPSTAMAEAQLASARYYQRPDQDYVAFEPNRTSLGGYSGLVQFDKIGGRWNYTLGANLVSPGFELNDAGFQTDADRIRLAALVRHRWLSPTRVARSAELSLRLNKTSNFGGEGPGLVIGSSGYLETHGFSSVSFAAEHRLRGLDDRATRGGPLVEAPSQTTLNGTWSTDSRKVVSGALGVVLTRDARGNHSYLAETSVSIQLPRGHSITIAPSFQRLGFESFYLAGYADPTATATFGTRYVFAPLDQHTFGFQTRLNFYFTPSLSLQIYAQPFVASADFAAPTAFATPRTYQFNRYGQGGSTLVVDPVTEETTVDADGAGPAPSFTYPNLDFRLRSLRSNVVLRWEYRPGSTLFVVWNQNRFSRAADPRFRVLRDLRGIFDDDMQNVLLLKANYYFSF